MNVLIKFERLFDFSTFFAFLSSFLRRCLYVHVPALLSITAGGVRERTGLLRAVTITQSAPETSAAATTLNSSVATAGDQSRRTQELATGWVEARVASGRDFSSFWWVGLGRVH